jgi:hypothetical protein
VKRQRQLVPARIVPCNVVNLADVNITLWMSLCKF